MVQVKKEDSKGKSSMFVDCEIVHDSVGIMSFLPPKKCKNCDG